MPRRITTGISGRAVLGDIVTQNNTLQSVVTNANIVFTPDGTGVSEFTKDILVSNNNGIRLEDGDTNYVKIKANATMASNYTLTMPAADGSSGQALTTNGSGTLSWSSLGLTVVNRTAADNNTYYLAMTDVTSGPENEISVANSTRLEFVPNPGLLKVNSVAVQSSTASSSTSTGALTIAGGVGIGGQMTAVSIVETSSIALKENIAPLNNALDSVMKLSGVSYDRLDTKEHETGLIAEWTAKVIPDLVTYDEEGNTVGIKYTKLTAYLIEAVKTLKQEIDELRNK